MRISGIDIPDNKKIEYSLAYVRGIGRSNSKVILRSANVDLNKKAGDLTREEISKVQAVIDKNYKIEGDLRREVSDNIKHLKEIGTWRGMRHSRGLPIRGRSKTNSRTTRGNVRKTMGSGRKPTAQKT